MVKGNKFKPGEPPKKRRKVGLAADAAAPSTGYASVQDKHPGAAKAMTLLEVLSASRPRETLPSEPKLLLNGRQGNSAASGRPPQSQKPAKARKLGQTQPVDEAHSSAKKRQKLGPVDGQSKAAAAVAAASIGQRVQPGAVKTLKDRRKSEDRANQKDVANPKHQNTDNPKPKAQGAVGTKSTANSRRKARQKARQLQENGSAANSSGQSSTAHTSRAEASKPTAEDGSAQPLTKPDAANDRAGTPEAGAAMPRKGNVQQGKPRSKLSMKTDTSKPGQGSGMSSNWNALKTLIGAGGRDDAAIKGLTPQQGLEAKRPEPKGVSAGVTEVLAVDCEMVGVGPHGTRSSLARVCVVNDQGNVLLDKFVRQKERVTDFRTRFSGIRPQDVAGSTAEPFAVVQKEAADLFKDRILVGHALQNDLKALLLSHPVKSIRDTAKYPPLMKAALPGRKPRPRALRHLAFEELGLGIQEGEHSPVEDARCALYLYQRHQKVWEQHLKRGTMHLLKPPETVPEYDKKPTSKSLAQYALKDIMVDL